MRIKFNKNWIKKSLELSIFINHIMIQLANFLIKIKKKKIWRKKLKIWKIIKIQQKNKKMNLMILKF